MLLAQIPTPPPGVDPNLVINQLMPLVGMILTFGFIGFALRWFLRSPIAEAIGERIRARTRDRFGVTGTNPAIEGDRVAHLEQDVTSLQSQLSELAERVDFAERLLADKRDSRLSAGR